MIVIFKTPQPNRPFAKIVPMVFLVIPREDRPLVTVKNEKFYQENPTNK